MRVVSVGRRRNSLQFEKRMGSSCLPATYSSFPQDPEQHPFLLLFDRTVFEEPLSISESQLYALRSLKDGEERRMVDNYRPVQPLNGRRLLITRDNYTRYNQGEHISPHKCVFKYVD